MSRCLNLNVLTFRSERKVLLVSVCCQNKNQHDETTPYIAVYYFQCIIHCTVLLSVLLPYITFSNTEMSRHNGMNSIKEEYTARGKFLQELHSKIIIFIAIFSDSEHLLLNF